MAVNPYESPLEVNPAPISVPGSDTAWIAIRKMVATGGVAFGGLLGLMGQIITFVPGAQAKCYGFAALLSLLGLLWPGWKVRAVAAVLFIWLACQAWDGHLKGKIYREWMRQRDQTSAESGRKMGAEK